MKKIICITIALCLVFASVLPVYAEAWSSSQATSVTNNVAALVRVFTGSVGTMYNSVSELMSWLTPAGSFSTSHSITGVTLYEIVDYIAWTLSGVGPTVYDTFQSMGSMLAYMPSLDSKLTTANNYLNSLVTSNIQQGTFTEALRFQNAHYNLVDANGIYNHYLLQTGNTGAFQTLQRSWRYGTPLGNIAYILSDLALSFNRSAQNDYTYLWKHSWDTLSTWDSQGNTLTQIEYNPESFAQMIYRYLAFTQRDVARLAYVFANDEELEARELAQANQEQVLDDFINPNGDGSVSTTDLGNMTAASDGFKSNFSTNVGSSHIWDVFDNSRYNWFTQQTKNQLDTTQQTRSLKAVQDDYPTPLLDNYYNEMFGIIGVDIND